MAHFIAAEAVGGLIRDRATVALDGFTMFGVPEALLEAIETAFLASGSPRDLTLVHAAGPTDGERGIEHFAHERMVSRVIGSYWGYAPRLSRMLTSDGVEAVCLPQGQLSELYRAIASGRPGNLSRVGLETFIDPRVEGGRVNSAAQNLPINQFVDLVTIHGANHLLYKAFPLDVGLIRATVADEDGNCSQSEELVQLDALSLAQAVHNSGGIVVCQVKTVVPRGTIPPMQVTIPASIVDFIHVVDDPDSHHRQTHSFSFDERLLMPRAKIERSFDLPSSSARNSVVDPSVLDSIGQRAVALLREGDVINIGGGTPSDAIPRALAAAGADPAHPAASVTVTIESGVHGGRPGAGLDFGMSLGAAAIIPHAAQFNMYNGGGLDLTFLGVGQIDRHGNVNVSLLGPRLIGVGGFVDIVAGARRICFCLVAEGAHPKFVEDVDHRSFSAAQALTKGTEVCYVTESASFRLTWKGLELYEVAKNANVRQVLANIPFEVAVAIEG